MGIRDHKSMRTDENTKTPVVHRDPGVITPPGDTCTHAQDMTRATTRPLLPWSAHPPTAKVAPMHSSPWALAPLLLLLACTAAPPRPLIEELVGEWEVWCRTDVESTATCLGKEDHGLYKNFRPGGEVISGARRGTEMRGTWTLTGDELAVTFQGGGIQLTERYRARIEDGRLVLWYPSGGFGAVHGRVGATFDAAPGKKASRGRTTHAIGGLAYSLALPADYALTRDDNNRQQWSPTAGEGFVVHLTLSPRPQHQVGGNWVTPPCSEYDGGGVLSSAREIDGVDRDTSIGRSLCIDGTDHSLMCSTEHTRGYLEQAEHDAALALCTSLTVER